MPEQRGFTDRDDHFHFEEMGGDWWATETAWFSFHHPQRRLGGWFYTMVRPNIGTVAGGAWVWDDSAHLPWEVLYSANYTALQLPRDQDLNDITLPTGVSIRVIEPCTSYALGYADGERLQASLRFDGVMPPESLTSTGSTFGHAQHFDQIGHVTGELVLHGETIAIDCLAVRDRTWGRRPSHRERPALPRVMLAWSPLETWPTVARQSRCTLRISPLGRRTCAHSPSFAMSCAETPAERTS